MTTLLEKTRQINQLLQQKHTFDLQAEFPYSKMAITLSEVLLSNAYILSNEGILLGYNEKHNINNERVRHMVKEGQFPQSYISASNQLIKTEANISIDSDLTIFPVELRSKYPDGLTTIIPVYCAGERLGLIVLARMDTSFDEDDLVLAEYSATVVGMQILYQKSRSIEAEVRGATAVQMAINTLSYSELIAVQAIFKALEGDEGRLTTSSIADEIGITRSVIVNALRKLESAGIIESRSLGMKGTYLRILNPQFTKELEKNNH